MGHHIFAIPPARGYATPADAEKRAQQVKGRRDTEVRIPEAAREIAHQIGVAVAAVDLADQGLGLGKAGIQIAAEGRGLGAVNDQRRVILANLLLGGDQILRGERPEVLGRDRGRDGDGEGRGRKGGVRSERHTKGSSGRVREIPGP